MFAIIGIVVVFGSIVGGYLMEHGNLMVLIQPAELLIIGGAAAGTVLIANPLHILKQIAGGPKIPHSSRITMSCNFSVTPCAWRSAAWNRSIWTRCSI